MKKYKLVCKTPFSAILIQMLLWTLLTLITFGLATPFFIYYMVRMVINHTEMHEIEDNPLSPPHNKPW